MALKKEDLRLVCSCSNQTFELIQDESGQVTLDCTVCGEAYTLEYVMEVINGEVDS